MVATQNFSRTHTQVVLVVRTAEAVLVLLPGAVEVNLWPWAGVLASEEDGPASPIGLHVTPHQHRLTARTPGDRYQHHGYHMHTL